MLLWDALLQSRHGIDEDAAQIKTNYVRLMGPHTGEAFAELMQGAARLHLKWNGFLALFAVSPAQIDTLNKAAPGFFYLVSEAWWDGLILHILRMTDANRKVLLSKCGVCVAGFFMAGRNRLACFGAREKGTCDNRLTIRRDEVEARVLKALEEKFCPRICSTSSVRSPRAR